MDKVGKFYSDAKERHKRELHDRFNEIVDAAEITESYYKSKYPEADLELFLSDESLDSAIKSYFYDIYRYKHFHGMLDSGKTSKVNYPKVYAFTMKWIIKEKPFYLEPKNKEYIKIADDEYSIILDRINENIIVNWMEFSHFAHTKREMKLEKGERRHLIYNLKFRDISTGFLEFFLTSKVDNEAISRI